MSRTAKTWVPALVTFASVGLLWVWEPAAVGLSFVAMFATIGLMFGFSVPATRLAFYFALLAHAATVYLASGSAPAGLCVLFAGLGLRPDDELTKRFLSGFSAHRYLPLVFLFAAVALFVLAWPIGGWRWAAAPILVLSILMFATLHAPTIKAVLEDNEIFRSAVKVGDKVPDFTLPYRLGGGEFTLSERRGSYVLLSFLRGDWCPSCQVMMRIFKKEAPRLAKHDVHLVVVNPSSGPEAVSFAEDLGLNYTVLVDENCDVARRLGPMQSNQYRGQPIALPLAMLIDPEGTIRFISKPDDASFFNSASEFGKILERAGHSLAAG